MVLALTPCSMFESPNRCLWGTSRAHVSESARLFGAQSRRPWCRPRKQRKAFHHSRSSDSAYNSSSAGSCFGSRTTIFNFAVTLTPAPRFSFFWWKKCIPVPRYPMSTNLLPGLPVPVQFEIIYQIIYHYFFCMDRKKSLPVPANPDFCQKE